MKRFLLVVCVLFVVSSSVSVAEGRRFFPGDRVKIIGAGYQDPHCRGFLGLVWDFFDPDGYANTCFKKIPKTGFGYIQPNLDGVFVLNGCYRVLLDGNTAGWYPTSSLLLWASYQKGNR